MITVTVQDRQVTETLQRLLGRLGDLTPAMAGIATATDPLG